MNWWSLLFGQMTVLLNFYAEEYLETDKRQMIADVGFNSNYGLPVPEVYDFIVVGGGAAGCLVANRLATANFSVLVLEKGGNPPPLTFVPGNLLVPFETQHFTDTYEGNVMGRVISLPAGRVLGGSTTVNAMIFNRGSPFNYDEWANITGDDAWSYENMLQHFRAFENYAGQHSDNVDDHGFDGELAVETMHFGVGVERFFNAGQELGFEVDTDPNGPQRANTFTKYDKTMSRGRRATAFSAFLNEEIQDQLPNLKIHRYATAEQILFNDSNAAVGVYYLRHGIPATAYARNEIIISAGALATPKLLLKSGIGPAQELDSVGLENIVDLPGVGRNLQDHPKVPLYFHLNTSDSTYIPELNFTQNQISEFLTNGSGYLTLGGGNVGQAYFTSSFSSHPNWSDYQVFYSAESGIPNVVAVTLDLDRPRSTGRVTLHPENIDADPMIDLSWFSDPIDTAIYLEGVRRTLEIFENTTAFQSVDATLYLPNPMPQCDVYEFRSDNFWRCYLQQTVRTGFHLAGSCKMGMTTDPNAVVDSQLNVFGVQNLRIVDASIMPMVTNSNTMAPTYGIAQKAATDILNQYRRN